jgi:hypothetical protein
MKQSKPFPYYPVNIQQAYTKKEVKGFQFPADGKVFDETNPADIENLQQFQLYFGVHEVISSLNDIMRTGTDKTNRIYSTLIEELINDYADVCKACLKLASSMCWVPVYNNKEKVQGYAHKLTPERAIYEIEPAIKGLLLAVQTKMDLTYPVQLVKNITRLEIEKEILELKETTGNVKKIVSK